MSSERRVANLSLEPLSGTRTTVQQHVHGALRDAILTGRLAAGERLVLTELADSLNVSTTPVREALRELASSGLVKLDSHRGAMVTQLSDDEVDEIYRIRLRLEPEVMCQALKHLTEDELVEAEVILRKAEAEEDPAAWFHLNRQFHQVFVDASQSPRLQTMVTALNDQAALYVVVTWAQDGRIKAEADAQHRQILEAARDRDVELSEVLAAQHIRTTIAHLPSRMQLPQPMVESAQAASDILHNVGGV